MSAPAVSAIGGASVAPSVAEASFSAPSAIATGVGSSSPDALSLVASLPAITVSGGAVAPVSLLEVSMSAPNAGASGGGTASASALSAVFSAPEATATGEGAPVYAPADTSVLTFSAPTASAIGSATAYPEPAVIGPYKLIYLLESDRFAIRFKENIYLEL